MTDEEFAYAKAVAEAQEKGLKEVPPPGGSLEAQTAIAAFFAHLANLAVPPAAGSVEASSI